MLECLGIVFSTNPPEWNHVLDYNDVSWMMHFWDNSRDDSIAGKIYSIVVFFCKFDNTFL